MIYGVDYEEMQEHIRNLSRDFPFLRVTSLGTSVMHREIPALWLGEGKEYVLYLGGVHGAERLTSYLLLSFMEALCRSRRDGSLLAGVDPAAAMTGRGLVVVPLLNPDGFEISLKGIRGCGNLAGEILSFAGTDLRRYQANAHGVDLNHNFDAGWQALHALERKAGILGPSATRYGGPAPESEPETVAITRLCRAVRLSHALAFHSQGQVIYWDYGDKTPQRSKRMAELLAQHSGYALDTPTGLAVGGGFKDWFISAFHRPAFTVEIGKGENPLPDSDLPSIYQKLEEMLTIALFL